MAIIQVSPDDTGDSTRRIQWGIDASQPGDTLVFDAGVYVLDGPLYLQGDRDYVSQSTIIFQKSPDFKSDPDVEHCMIIVSKTEHNIRWGVQSIMDTPGWT